MKEINWSNYLPTLLGYFKQKPNWLDAVVILVAILVLFIISNLIIASIINKNKDSVFYKKTITLFLSFTISITALTIFSVYGIFYNNIIYKSNLQAPVLIYFIILLTLVILTIHSFLKKIKSKSPVHIGFQSAPIQQNNLVLSLTSSLKKRKIYFIIVFLPFLLLLLRPPNFNLYSIVFDNSGSMDVQNENAKIALNSIINNLNDNSNYIISQIPFCKGENGCLEYVGSVKKDLNSIVQVGGNEQLVSTTNFFENKNEFSDYINSSSLSITEASSPIYECIWDNFRKSVKLNNEHAYNKRSLIVLTDGADNLYAPVEYKFTAPTSCISNYSFNKTNLSDFYDNIKFISYTGSDKGGIFNTCGQIEVLNGENLDELTKSITSQFDDVFIDKIFLVTIFSLLFLSFLIILNLK